MLRRHTQKAVLAWLCPDCLSQALSRLPGRALKYALEAGNLWTGSVLKGNLSLLEPRLLRFGFWLRLGNRNFR